MRKLRVRHAPREDEAGAGGGSDFSDLQEVQILVKCCRAYRCK